MIQQRVCEKPGGCERKPHLWVKDGAVQFWCMGIILDAAVSVAHMNQDQFLSEIARIERENASGGIQ